MKTVKYEFYGQTLHLRLTSAALYDIYDAYGHDGSVFDHITGSDRTSFDAACWYLQKLAEQGELTRRWEGFEPSEIPSLEQLRLLMTPADLIGAKLALVRAINLGFGREIEDEEPVDLGLVEFEKKNSSGGKARIRFIHTATRILGLPLEEAQRLTPGEISDLIELESRRRRPARKE